MIQRTQKLQEILYLCTARDSEANTEDTWVWKNDSKTMCS